MSRKPQSPPPGGSLLIYESEDGRIKLDVRLEEESLWLTQPLMAQLFQTTQQNISQHILNIYEEGELAPEATHKEFLSVRREGSRQVRRELDYYNLDAIISVGYRVKSLIATRFRIWATQRLREYIVKGFAMDDERLKQAGAAGISRNCWPASGTSARRKRSSGARCWTSTPPASTTTRDEVSREFFKVIQNKMHWAAHGQTAPEVIYGLPTPYRPSEAPRSSRRA